jgi:hypothetical protein
MDRLFTVEEVKMFEIIYQWLQRDETGPLWIELILELHNSEAADVKDTFLTLYPYQGLLEKYPLIVEQEAWFAQTSARTLWTNIRHSIWAMAYALGNGILRRGLTNMLMEYLRMRLTATTIPIDSE